MAMNLNRRSNHLPIAHKKPGVTTLCASEPNGHIFGQARCGVTLVELMIAMALMTIGIVGLMGSFKYIQQAIQSSKNRTLASNLAQEKMQILKQKNYYQVLVTSDPAHNTTDFAPESIDYDTGYFPPEDITAAGVTYRRYTLIQVAREDSGTMVTLSPSTPDTGLRLITVTVVWSQGGAKKKQRARSLLANPNTVMANAVFNGLVRNSVTLAPISGALLNAAENMGWRDTTNASGIYSINMSPGNFTLVASAPGYYTEFRTVSIAANATQTQDFNLAKIATGTVTGTAWVNPNLLISQVVVETNTWVSAALGNRNVEYIELFNPTPGPIDIGVTGDPEIRIDYDCEPAGQDRAHTAFNFMFVSTYVAPGHYYLLASAMTFMINGSMINADACFGSAAGCNTAPTFPDYLDNNRAGDIELSRYSDNAVYDIVGWKDKEAGSDMPDHWEGTPIPNYTAADFDGMQAGNQIVRTSSPSFPSGIYGKAYDSGNNSADFIYPSATFTGISYPPRNSLAASQTLIAGTPAAGAVVTASDGLSASTVAWLSGTPPSAVFTLVDVATGTWTAIISSGNFTLENDTVTLAASGSVYNFPSSTTFLNQSATQGLITGRVLNAFGLPISAPSPIVLSPGAAGSDAIADTSYGRYTLRVSSGLVDVTANPANTNPSYVSISSLTILVEFGEVHSGVDFILSQGARISGFVTRDGINALPGVAMVILDSNDSSRDVQITGTDGRFTTISVSTGVYTVEPALSSYELSAPSSATVSLVTAGSTLFSTTFTVSGAMGAISGSVTSGGQPIKSGALIVVTTATLTGTPPAPPILNYATSTGGTKYYIVSSLETGVYTAEAPQGIYRVYAYYSTPSGATATILSSATANINVIAGQTTTGVNFSW